MYDVAIIGAGVIGTFIARELARYDLRIILIEKDRDVGNGITKANSAIVHSGYNAKPGTLKAKLNVESNPQFEKLCTELDVPFRRIGSLMIALDEEGLKKVKEKHAHGIENGVRGLEILSREQVLEMEPVLNPQMLCGLYAPTTGIVGPWELTIALAENAVDNGVELRLGAEIREIRKTGDGFVLRTEQEHIQAKYVINCAGLFADEINNLVASPVFRITPKRGVYFVLDQNSGEFVRHVIFAAHKKEIQSVIVAPTVHGNILVGPTGEEVDDKMNLKTTREQLERVRKSSELTSRLIPFDKTITTFAGLRPKPEILIRDEATGEVTYSDKGQDFIIGESPEVKGFINVLGIKSPGLSSAPAIARFVIDLLGQMGGPLRLNPSFTPYRRRGIRFKELSEIEKADLVTYDPRYGNIVCRCEQISEGEIVDCIHRSVGATTVDGVKKRVKPGMGRCQGGFCGPKVLEILARELKVDRQEVKKNGPDSYILTTRTKG